MKKKLLIKKNNYTLREWMDFNVAYKVVLTINIDMKSTTNWISNSIVGRTAVCSSISSVDVYNNPRASNM